MSEEEEQAQNQECVINCSEEYYSPTSKEHYNNGSEGPMEDEEYDDDEQVFLTRSNAFRGPTRRPEKTLMHGFGEQSLEPTSEEDEEPGDLAWYFRTCHPWVDKPSQIAWCRTYANMLAAQMPKNRPKTYKKRKTEEKK